MTILLVTVAVFALSTLVGLTLTWAGLLLLFRSIESRAAHRTVNGSISSVRVPSAS
ncbi:MAG TPA: hypothetical protein VIL35_17575 [Vicinamibacterales bacterium]